MRTRKHEDDKIMASHYSTDLQMTRYVAQTRKRGGQQELKSQVENSCFVRYHIVHFY